TPFLTTSENNPRKEDFPVYLAPEEDTARAKSSRRILTEKQKFTFDEWTRAATDTTVNEAAPAITRLIAAWVQLKEENSALYEKLAPAIRELSHWDFVARIDSIPTTLFLLTSERASRGGKRLDYDVQLRLLETVMDDLEKSFGTW